jgi:hypothetical protein
MYDKRQYIDDFETYLMFRKFVKMDVFHLRFQLSSALISHLLAEDAVFSMAFEDDQQMSEKDFLELKFLPLNYKEIYTQCKKLNNRPPDANRIW